MGGRGGGGTIPFALPINKIVDSLFPQTPRERRRPAELKIGNSFISPPVGGRGEGRGALLNTLKGQSHEIEYLNI
jgi:hypothetical protein